MTQRKTCTFLRDETTTSLPPTVVKVPDKDEAKSIDTTKPTEAVVPRPVDSISFEKELPYGITHEIEIIKRQTEKDNKEKSLTMCELDNKLFIGNNAKGSVSSTMVLPCHKKYGKGARQIGDIHTHPFNDKETIGLTPSEADFIANINQSFASGIPQVSCIVGAGKKSRFKKSNAVHCFQPKEELVNDSEKIKKYNRAYNHSANIGNDVHPFLRENIGDDFYHIWYRHDKAITKEEEQSPYVTKALFDEMLGQSTKNLRMKEIKDMEKGAFCDLIQSYNMPDNDNVGRICRDELEKRNILGYEY